MGLTANEHLSHEFAILISIKLIIVSHVKFVFLLPMART